jgi:transcriptional accessory protein Tex/SPT6
VIQAEQYGFREAAHVLDGARQMAAKELANDPNLRRYVRYDFERYSVAKVKLTSAGENSSEEYHREFVGVDKYHATPLREIGSESFLWMMKAYKEGLLDVDIKLPADRQEKLTEELMRYYKSDNSNPTAVQTNACARAHTHTHTHTHTYTHTGLVERRATQDNGGGAGEEPGYGAGAERGRGENHQGKARGGK